MRINSKDIPKPAKKDINDWVNNKLTSDEDIKRVILGLLVHKDEETQGYLEEVLSSDKKESNETVSIFEWFNKVAINIFDKITAVKDSISVVFQPADAGLSPLMMGKSKVSENSIDFKLYGSKTHDDQSESVSNYRIKLRSNTDFELKIKLPEGIFFVTLMYANSNDECGFIFPKLNSQKISPIINGPQYEYSVLENGDYELIKNESSTFKLTTVRYSDKEQEVFQKCVQLGEQMGVVRWLRHIEMDKDNKYSVATIFIEAE